jgi:SAM-dependent methyltransferase
MQPCKTAPPSSRFQPTASTRGSSVGSVAAPEPKRPPIITSLIPQGVFARRLAYELLYWWAPAHRLTTFNVGFAPLDAHIHADSRLTGEAHQIQLYAELFRRGEQCRNSTRPIRLLEVGAGNGGGLAYLAGRHAHVDAIGVDYAQNAVRSARRRGIDMRLGAADALPFDARQFDCVLCVDSMCSFPRDGFIREVQRVLRPGGQLLIGDYLTASEEATRGYVDALADLGGFTIELFENVTANVVCALEADNDRKRRMIAALPRFLGSRLAETLSLEGSTRHRDWRAGRICYYMAVLRRPGADGEPGRDIERHGPAREI